MVLLDIQVDREAEEMRTTYEGEEKETNAGCLKPGFGTMDPCLVSIVPYGNQ